MPVEGGSMISTDAKRPRYLRPHDDPWVRAACEAHRDLEGLALGDVERAWSERIGPELRALGAPASQLALVRRELDAVSTSRVDAPRDPREVRRHLFPLASVLPRDEALRRAAEDLELDPASIVATLFADRRPERRLVVPPELPDLAALRERCNLTLVQGWIMRCTELRVAVRENLHAIVRLAKLLGLLVDFVDRGGTTELRASGPIALFRRTVKYGRALARFFPCVLGSPGFSAVADCVDGDAPRRILIEAGDPLARRHALPRATDSAVERALVRDLRRLDTSWRLVREDRVVPLPGGKLFFPDFSLIAGERRVLVEIVGFYTAEYLRRKAAALAAMHERCIVCVDAALDCGESAFTGPDVMFFDKRVDPKALLALAERAA